MVHLTTIMLAILADILGCDITLSLRKISPYGLDVLRDLREWVLVPCFRVVIPTVSPQNVLITEKTYTLSNKLDIQFPTRLPKTHSSGDKIRVRMGI